jgi:hypothetical protein
LQRPLGVVVDDPAADEDDEVRQRHRELRERGQHRPSEPIDDEFALNDPAPAEDEHARGRGGDVHEEQKATQPAVGVRDRDPARGVAPKGANHPRAERERDCQDERDAPAAEREGDVVRRVERRLRPLDRETRRDQREDEEDRHTSSLRERTRG